MQNKIKTFMLSFAMVCVSFIGAVRADGVDTTDAQMDNISAAAVENYNVTGSMFEQITNLEQEKVLMQLEKERAQLDLDLDRLAAEKIKLHMEIDTLSGRAEQAAAEIETEKAKLEAEAARLAREKESLESGEYAKSVSQSAPSPRVDTVTDTQISSKYKLVNVIGAGTQLQATVSDLKTGQTKRIAVGRTLDGYTIKSISLDEGVVFAKDGKTETLNIAK